MHPTIAAALEGRPSLEPGLYTALSGTAAAGYDGKARVYDRLVGSPAYNRLVWATPLDWYGDVAERAAASGAGPLLEGGCGTALFTQRAWSETDRPLLLVDRSIDMLRIARERVGDDATLLQADLFDLPLPAASFETVCSFGVMHVLDDPVPALEQLWRCVAPGGQLWITSLVDSGRVLARAWYAALRLAGEAGPMLAPDALAGTIEQVTGTAPEVERAGAFALLVARAGS